MRGDVRTTSNTQVEEEEYHTDITMAPGALNSDASLDDKMAHTTAGRLQPGIDSTVDTLTLLRSLPEPPIEAQVCVVGAGPAGLMLAANLGRFGVQVEVVDERPDQTPVGRYALAFAALFSLT